MQAPLKALIVDDEPSARRILRSLLAEYEHVFVAGEAGSGREAITLISEQKPDVVFLDIQMPDLSGFEVIAAVEHPFKTVFTTAHDEFALKAFETFAIDYLLKPISEARFGKAMSKLNRLSTSEAKTHLAELKSFLEAVRKPSPVTSMAVRQGERILLIRYEEISHFEADDKYVALHTTEGKKFLLDKTLTELAAQLPANFLRVQKSSIINKDRILEIHKHFNGRFIIFLKDNSKSRISTGLTYYQSIKEALGI